MDTPTLTSSRLVLRPLKITDAPSIQQYFAHWDVIKNMGPAVPWPYPENGAECFLRESALPRAEKGEAHLWAITLKGLEADCVGVMEFRLEANEEGHRGFWLAQHLWGQGLMTEAVFAINDYVFDVLGYDEIIETNADFNEASRILKQKSGGVLINTRIKKNPGRESDRISEVWSIKRAGWQAIR